MLSESVSNGLSLVGGESATETVKFTKTMDKFFDALNVSNFSNGKKKRKPFQDPYRSEKDFRLSVCSTLISIIVQKVNVKCTFQWLEDDFLTYLNEWEASVKGREGFEDVQKKRMLLSEQTLLGLRMTGDFIINTNQA